MIKLAYLELPTKDIARAKHFYAAALGQDFTDFGPSYAGTMTGDGDMGLQGDSGEASALALPGFITDDLESAYANVCAAGGAISKPIFSYPGGRRFHFIDPDGHEISVFQEGE